MSRTRRHLTFANVISMVALFVALGGGSYAAMSTSRGGGKPSHAAKPGHPQMQAAEQSPGTGTPRDPEGDAYEPAESESADDSAGPEPESSQTFEPEASVDERSTDEGSSESRPPKVHELKLSPVAGGAGGHGKPAHHATGDEDVGGGPPPWAPAYGWRCKQVGNASGSPAFHACIESRKR